MCKNAYKHLLIHVKESLLIQNFRDTRNEFQMGSDYPTHLFTLEKIAKPSS